MGLKLSVAAPLLSVDVLICLLYFYYFNVTMATIKSKSKQWTAACCSQGKRVWAFKVLVLLVLYTDNQIACL